MFGKHSLGMEEKSVMQKGITSEKNKKVVMKKLPHSRKRSKKIRKTPEKKEILHHITQKMTKIIEII